MLLASLSFDHIGVVACFEDEIAFILSPVEVESFYIIADVA